MGPYTPGELDPPFVCCLLRYGRLTKVGCAGLTAAAAQVGCQVTLPLRDGLIHLANFLPLV